MNDSYSELNGKCLFLLVLLFHLISRQFNIQVKPLGEFASHSYGDDTQLFFSFPLKSNKVVPTSELIPGVYNSSKEGKHIKA